MTLAVHEDSDLNTKLTWAGEPELKGEYLIAPELELELVGEYLITLKLEQELVLFYSGSSALDGGMVDDHGAPEAGKQKRKLDAVEAVLFL